MNHQSWKKSSFESIAELFNKFNTVLHINDKSTPINPLQHSTLTKREEQYEHVGKPNRKQ